MVKKGVIVEELASESDQEFDGDFSDDQDQSQDAAPLTSRKEAKLIFEKSLPQKKTKKITKKVQIRGGDIFAQELPQAEIQGLKEKQAKTIKKEEELRIIEEQRHQLDKRNERVVGIV